MSPSDDRPDDTELRAELDSVQRELNDLLAGSMGRTETGNPELIDHAHQLERRADELRLELGMPAVRPPEQTKRATYLGWLALVGSVVLIIGTIAIWSAVS
jgi:hypothetical protein